MPVERLNQAMNIFGPVFVQTYGQLEAPMTITWLRKEEHVGSRLGSAGRPCTFVQVKVVNNENREVKPGEIGEVVVTSEWEEGRLRELLQR